MSDPTFSSINGTEGIDVGLLEKRLEGLRDTQESVQGLSLWCQSNKLHSNAITDTWLRVLRKSPVEKRLTLFYLANDVVQHAKRKSDNTVVNQWAFAVQKATPHVRSPSSVSSAITRIFKLWEERGVYSKEAIADLLSLLHNVSSKEKVERKPETYTANSEKVAAFHPSTLISKCKLAARLKSHLGTTFRTKSYCQMGMDTLKNSIKDRQHGQEVIQEMGALLEQLRTSEQKLQAEVDERRKIVETAEVAIVFYENVRSESEIVNSAYKSFTARIMKAKEAVDSKLKSFEDMEKEPSPCPSPPIAAPSPPEDDEYGQNIPTAIPSQVSGFNSTKPSVSSSSDSIPSSHDAHTISNITPNIPIMQPANIPSHMSYNNNNNNNPHHPMSVGGFDSHHLPIHQQQQQIPSWPPNNNNNNENFAPMMMNQGFVPPTQPHRPLPPPQTPSLQNFTLTPSMQLQMQMQQQHIQQFGYPSNNNNPLKYEQSDVSSIPLPPQVPGNPPLPPSHQDMMYKQYPPLPPKHDPPPEIYPQKLPTGEISPRYPPSINSQPGESMYQSHSQQQQPQDNNMYQSHKQENMYQVRNIPSTDSNMYQRQGSQPDENNINLEFQQQQSGPPSQENLVQYEADGTPGHMSSHPSDFDYEPTFIDNQNQQQQDFDRPPKHYTPTNFHQFNPTPRNRGHPPRPRHIQPLTSPTISHRPRFQPRTPNTAPRMLRPHTERYHNPPIPSLLETPGSTIPQSRPTQINPPTFESFANFHDPGPGDSNTGRPGNEHDYQFEQYQQQQQHHHHQLQHRHFEENNLPPSLLTMNSPSPLQHQNPRNRGPGRGFRGGGGFRGLPRMRGPGGPRRGRF